MPYKKFKSGDGWKVWKVDDEGKKVGDPMSDEPMDEDKADAQVRALYANEKKEGGPLPDNTDTHEKMYDDDEMAMPMMVGAGPTSLKAMVEAKMAKEAAEDMNELSSMFKAVVDNIMWSDIEEKGAAIIKAAGEFAEMGRTVNERIARKNPFEKEASEAKAKAQLIGDKPKKIDKPADKAKSDDNLFIWKEGDTYKWIAAYSNNRRDDDNPPEIISSESHKAFDEAVNKGEFPMPELWLWHLPYRVGVAQWHAYDAEKGFPIAAGSFDAGKEWVAEALMSSKEWTGVSHGMPKSYIKRDPADPTIITRHVTKEISILPAWAAANKLSFHLISKESSMQDEKALPAHKLEGLINLAGEERAKEVEAAIADKAKEADDDGIEKKEETPAERKLSDRELTEAFVALKESLDAINARLDAMETEQKEVKESDDFDLVSFLKSKSVIGAKEAQVDGRSKEAKDGPAETETPSETGQGVGLPISFIDRIFQANQAYANGGK